MKPQPLPPTLCQTGFSTAAARRAGVSAERLRRRDLQAPFHGVRAVGSAELTSLEDRCLAYLPVMEPAAFFSHITAACLYGLPLPQRATRGRGLHVSVPSPVRAPRGSGIIGHQLADASFRRRIVHGVPVPPPVDVWCQLASLLTVDELVIAGDALLRRKSPTARRDDLEAAVARCTGRPGVTRLRLALPLIRARTDSPMETVLRLAIVAAGLPEPVVNYRIHCDGIDLHADLAYPVHRMVVEYDGDHHRTDQRQYFRDVDRIRAIEDAGWRVIRINRTHLASGTAVSLVRAALRRTSRQSDAGTAQLSPSHAAADVSPSGMSVSGGRAAPSRSVTR